MAPKALVFLRHNNDVDQIVPVLWKWLSTSDVHVEAIVYGEVSLLDDPRLQFLDSFERFQIRHVHDFLPGEQRAARQAKAENENTLWERYRNRHEHLSTITELPRHHPRRVAHALWRRVRSISPRPSTPERFWRVPCAGLDRQFAETMLDKLVDDTHSTLLVFDWITSRSGHHLTFVRNVLAAARKRDLPAVSLPHGDEPHACTMIRNDELDRAKPDIYAPGAEFDALVVPNELCRVRYRPHMPPARVPVLGSARYNKEWVSIVGDLLPAFDPPEAQQKIRLAMFLRDSSYPLFWEEIARTTRMILSIPDFHLAVVHHPRGLESGLIRGREMMPYKEPGITAVGGDVPSGSLIRWADAVLDLGTSAVFEAVRLNKPILSMEYLHATYTTVSRLMPETICHCRDHVLDAIEALHKDPSAVGLNPVSRRRFLSEVVDVPDENVLPRYVEFLNGMLHGGER